MLRWYIAGLVEFTGRVDITGDYCR